jgi:hypothetical protein
MLYLELKKRVINTLDGNLTLVKLVQVAGVIPGGDLSTGLDFGQSVA